MLMHIGDMLGQPGKSEARMLLKDTHTKPYQHPFLTLLLLPTCVAGSSDLPENLH
jgi:hypothetical protein